MQLLCYDAICIRQQINLANLLKLIAKVTCSIIVKLNNKDHIYTLCIDDTIIERAKGKHIEGVSRTFDHVRGKCVKGFANLLICWSDGTNIFPEVSALMSSRKEKYIIRDFDKKIDNRNAGAKRRADSKQRKPSMVYRYCKSMLVNSIWDLTKNASVLTLIPLLL